MGNSRVRLIVISIITAFLLNLAFAEENVTSNTTIANSSEEIMIAEPENITNEVTNETSDVVVDEAMQVQKSSFEIFNITPLETIVGDVTFEIQVKNTGNTELKHLVPVLVARGFATYDTIPVASLGAGEVGAAYVVGEFGEGGNIVLTAKINEKLFQQMVKVKVPDEETSKALEEEKAALLQAQSEKLKGLEANYDSLLDEIQEKKGKYDLSDVKTESLKAYLRTAESDIATGEAGKAKVSLILAANEYADQKLLLDAAKKKPFINKIKDNIILISSIAGAVITIFAFYELLKKKKNEVYQKIKEVKVDKDTRIIVEKKQEERTDEPANIKSDETKEDSVKEEKPAEGGNINSSSDEDVLKTDKTLNEIMK